MKIYLKGYIQRWKDILLTVMSILLALLLSFVLFHGKLIEISAQLESYAQEDYSLIYVLNYAAPLENEFIFPDTDVQVFLDESKGTRLTVSGIMKDEQTPYNSEWLSIVNNLDSTEITISKNVAKKYEIGIGDSLYIEFPYSSDLQRYTVTDLIGVNYDFTRPNIDNDIGIVFIGFDEEYKTNVKSRYIAFSKDSEAEILSAYPQIINTVINKAESERYVLGQGKHILVFQSVFVLIAMALSYVFFYVKSGKLLKRCYLKGLKKIALVWIPFMEIIVFSLIPAILTIWGISHRMSSHSIIVKLYFMIPVVSICIFCVGTACVEMGITRRKGG